jgi:hypothetical protein
MENGELKIKNNMFFWDTVQSEYMKACEKHPVDFSKEFDIRGVVLFNNPLVKGDFWHSNNGSGLPLNSLGYASLIDARSANGFEIIGLGVIQTNPGFTGIYIDFTHSPSLSDASNCHITNCMFNSSYFDGTHYTNYMDNCEYG